MKHDPIKLHSALWLESARANNAARQRRHARIQRRIFYVLGAIFVAVAAYATRELWMQ